jgi:hypothetical protein
MMRLTNDGQIGNVGQVGHPGKALRSRGLSLAQILAQIRSMPGVSMKASLPHGR